MSVIDSMLAGDRLALSRMLTQVENASDAGRAALDELFIKTGKAHLIGVTGAPGTGKSSLVNRLVQLIRREKKLTAAVVAVDPSSPFSGGAILGDRVRMHDLSGDPGVFIRSMATRGELGGLARATSGIVQVLDAAGFDLIFIETVGAGQSEVDIARLAHTTIVVESPGMGDDIQAIKAGILEIADVLVINKADLPGVDNTERALRANLDLGYSNRINGKSGHRSADQTQKMESGTWSPPVIKTIATGETGVDDLIKAIFDHRDYLRKTGLDVVKDRERMQSEFDHLLNFTLVEKWKSAIPSQSISVVMEEVYARKCSPGQAIERLVSE
jgi:LAO/AO transport system kinase